MKSQGRQIHITDVPMLSYMYALLERMIIHVSHDCFCPMNTFPKEKEEVRQTKFQDK